MIIFDVEPTLSTGHSIDGAARRGIDDPERMVGVGISIDGPPVFSRRELLQVHVTERTIRSQLESGEWLRLLPGTYVTRAGWNQARADHACHVRTLVAVAASALGYDVAASHLSAAVVLGLPLLDEPPRDVTVARAGGKSRRLVTPLGTIRVRPSSLPREDVTVVDGVPATSAARTTIDVARTSDLDLSVAVADAALHANLTTLDELCELSKRCYTWSGIRHARRVIDFADGRAESPLESVARVGFQEEGLPAPQLQEWIYDEYGEPVARVDFLWPQHRTIVEADGLLKYAATEAFANPLVAEKLRQERLADLGYEVVRITWRQARYLRPATARRIRAAFARAERWTSS